MNISYCTHTRLIQHNIITIMYMCAFLDDGHPFPHDTVLETSNCGGTQIPGSAFCQTLDRFGITPKNISNMTGFEKQFQVIITSINDGLCTTIA